MTYDRLVAAFGLPDGAGAMAVFGIAVPTPDPGLAVKGTLPQTFLERATEQAEDV